MLSLPAFLSNKSMNCSVVKGPKSFTFRHFHLLLRLPCKCQPLPQNSEGQKSSLLYGVNNIYHKNFSVYGYSWFMLSSSCCFTEGCHLERLCNQALCGGAQQARTRACPRTMRVLMFPALRVRG